MKYLIKCIENFQLDLEDRMRFFNKILPQLASVAKFITTGPHSNLLARFKANNTKLSLTRFEIASLLCNAFLCTFPQDGNPKISFAE